MLTVFWSPLGFRIINFLPRRQKFNAQYLIENILTPITQTHPGPAINNKRRVVIHMDNSPVHRSAIVHDFSVQNRLFLCDHPAYSPDLAPSDFYLFGKLKIYLMGRHFESYDELFDCVTDFLNGIQRSELESVMEEWEARLQKCIDLQGDYVE